MGGNNNKNLLWLILLEILKNKKVKIVLISTLTITLLLTLVITISILHSIHKSEFEQKEAIKLDSIMILGSQGATGLEKESMTQDFQLRTRGFTKSLQIIPERDSLIFSYGLDAKSYPYAYFSGFVEINEQGEDTKYRLSREHDFSPVSDNFHVYQDFILTVSSSVLGNEIGIFDLDAEEFVKRQEVNGDCQSLTGLNEQAYVSCENRDGDMTIYEIDLIQFTIEETIQVRNSRIVDMTLTEEHGLLAAIVQNDRYFLTQIDDTSMDKLTRMEDTEITLIAANQNSIYMLKEDLGYEENTKYVASYDIEMDDHKMVSLEDDIATIDIEAVDDHIYVISRDFDMGYYLLVMNHDLEITNQYQLENISPWRVVVEP
ncbi:hypothetical protein [Alkalibacillus haloalkaliphilus]|uniref:Uncharacterized protein n=1 Tax=Alkalibacillus haloalkaliphilus TaxID=94136 RepID=A0A511W4T7_9BACI|nr:hypothetical protein [Alkalibacillus haloalkaliphilus]GEN45967.1 hypothetical protein AHA02nite_17430 [Alkalibacillus haloalkaliphilus]